MTAVRPSRRGDFKIGIFCALPKEYDAVYLTFDEFWDEDGDTYGRAGGDFNTYTTGRIGVHNVVLTLLPQTGKSNAASAAANMRASYRSLQLVLLVGVCGAAPLGQLEEILLGDVIISDTVIQYDRGWRHADVFRRKDTLEDNLGRPNKDIRSLLKIFETESGLDRLKRQTSANLKHLQRKRPRKYRYPGPAKDRLFLKNYRHTHHTSPNCGCNESLEKLGPVCEKALGSTCTDLGCDETYLVPRERLRDRQDVIREGNDMVQEPEIHLGAVASGDTVMQSAIDRDRISETEGVIAFEMEGAGLWDELPCIVIKGANDYSDSHKNNVWKDFAAATAAAVSKAVLNFYIRTDEDHHQSAIPTMQAHTVLPFDRNADFVGREPQLKQILKRIPPSAQKDSCQRTAISGLGGVGKTSTALEAAFQVRDAYPDCSIFWVSAVDANDFHNSYRKIGLKLQLPVNGTSEQQGPAQVTHLVKNALSQESAGSWLMIIDNADDHKLMLCKDGLFEYLPSSRSGSVLITTRTHQVAIDLNTSERGRISVPAMTPDDARQLLATNLKESQMQDITSTTQLLEHLEFLPLAIRQASAFMAETGSTTNTYLKLCQKSDKTRIELLSKNFEDSSRGYKNAQNAVAMTWLISFEHISEQTPRAGELIKSMCLFSAKNIPLSLLCDDEDALDVVEAIGVLKGYTFVTEREDHNTYDMHRLVALSMRSWLNTMGDLEKYVKLTMILALRAASKFGDTSKLSWNIFPHLLALWEFRHGCSDAKVRLAYTSIAAYCCMAMGKAPVAERICREGMELAKQHYEHSAVIYYKQDIAISLLNQKKPEAAESMQLEVFHVMRRTMGEGHNITMESGRWTAEILIAQRRHGLAKLLLQYLLRKATNKESGPTIWCLCSFARVCCLGGEYEEAERIFTEIGDLMERSPEARTSYNHAACEEITIFAIYLARQGKEEKAETLCRKILQRQENWPNTFARLRCRHNLALVLDIRNKLDEAEQILRETAGILEGVLGSTSDLSLLARGTLVRVLGREGKWQEAERIGRETVEICEGLLPQWNYIAELCVAQLAEVLASQGKKNEAVSLMDLSLSRLTESFGPDDPQVMESLETLTAWKAKWQLEESQSST